MQYESQRPLKLLWVAVFRSFTRLWKTICDAVSRQLLWLFIKGGIMWWFKQVFDTIAVSQ